MDCGADKDVLPEGTDDVVLELTDKELSTERTCDSVDLCSDDSPRSDSVNNATCEDATNTKTRELRGDAKNDERIKECEDLKERENKECDEVSERVKKLEVSDKEEKCVKATEEEDKELEEVSDKEETKLVESDKKKEEVEESKKDENKFEEVMEVSDEEEDLKASEENEGEKTQESEEIREINNEGKKNEDLKASEENESKEKQESEEIKEVNDEGKKNEDLKASEENESKEKQESEEIREVNDEGKKNEDLKASEENESKEKQKSEEIKEVNDEGKKNEDLKASEENESKEKQKSEEIREINDDKKNEDLKVSEENERKEKQESEEVREVNDEEKKNEDLKASEENKSKGKQELKEVNNVNDKEKKTEGLKASEESKSEASDKNSENKEVDNKRLESVVNMSARRGEESECEMDVDDPDPYPEHINFVDVNAPTTCDSPLVIDDDDDDDDIVMIERKRSTNRVGRSRNRGSTRTDDSSPEIVQEGQTKRRQEIVIDLDDDDDIEIETIKKRKKNRSNAPKGVNCCNIECSSPGLDLRSAPVFVLTYYGRKYKKGKAEKVCLDCFEAAVQHHEHLYAVLSDHKPLMTVRFHPRNDTVVLTDSDEEGSEEEAPMPEEVLADLEDKLQEVMESTLENYDLDFQIEESQNILTEKLDKLSVGFKETDNLLNELQRKMDHIRHDVYKDYAPKIRELPSLTIDDSQFGTRQPIIRFSPPRTVPQPQSRQKIQVVQKTPTTSIVSSSPSKQRTLHTSPITSDVIKKSPIAGVATKKVTQIQRSVMPGNSHIEMNRFILNIPKRIFKRRLMYYHPRTTPQPISRPVYQRQLFTDTDPKQYVTSALPNARSKAVAGTNHNPLPRRKDYKIPLMELQKQSMHNTQFNVSSPQQETHLRVPIVQSARPDGTRTSHHKESLSSIMPSSSNNESSHYQSDISPTMQSAVGSSLPSSQMGYLDTSQSNEYYLYPPAPGLCSRSSLVQNTSSWLQPLYPAFSALPYNVASSSQVVHRNPPLFPEEFPHPILTGHLPEQMMYQFTSTQFLYPLVPHDGLAFPQHPPVVWNSYQQHTDMPVPHYNYSLPWQVSHPSVPPVIYSAQNSPLLPQKDSYLSNDLPPMVQEMCATQNTALHPEISIPHHIFPSYQREAQQSTQNTSCTLVSTPTDDQGPPLTQNSELPTVQNSPNVHQNSLDFQEVGSCINNDIPSPKKKFLHSSTPRHSGLPHHEPTTCETQDSSCIWIERSRCDSPLEDSSPSLSNSKHSPSGMSNQAVNYSSGTDETVDSSLSDVELCRQISELGEEIENQLCDEDAQVLFPNDHVDVMSDLTPALDVNLPCSSRNECSNHQNLLAKSGKRPVEEIHRFAEVTVQQVDDSRLLPSEKKDPLCVSSDSSPLRDDMHQQDLLLPEQLPWHSSSLGFHHEIISPPVFHPGFFRSVLLFRPTVPRVREPYIKQRQEDVVALEQVEVTHKPLPPIGTLARPKPRACDVMYVMKLSFYGVWARAKVLEVVPKGTELSSGSVSLYNMYKVKFESSYRKSNPVKQVTGKQMAYTSPSPVRFPVGTRVIAIFQDNDWSKECYYSGVIAEPPKSMNKYRYLVFFDDGYAQYVSHEKILLVCESSRNVWEDIHPDSREFIRKYLEQYPERPMVKLQQGQIVKTEWNGKWWIARVVEVDGSLVKMHFDADGRTEWIYRGSTRLGPLYAELAHAAARKEQGTFSRHRGLGVASLKKRNMPYVEYTRGTDGEELRRDESGDGSSHSVESVPSRAVAKKSTTKRPDSIMDKIQEQHQSYPGVVEKSQQPQGRVEYLQLNTSRRRPKKFEPHQCGPNCLLGAEYDSKAMKGENPLVVPMLCAWERQVNRCRGKRVVIYRAPCGRRLRNMEELHRYLRIAKSNMAVDLFDFDFWVHCFAEFVLERGFSNIKDLSYGAEHVPVPCVNCVDHSLPDYVSYSTKREPMDGVNLNIDPEFLTGCDCTDDCQDRDKCACWQLTIQGTAYGPGGVVDPTVGYIYRRLPEPVMTGIYECNSRCKCSNTCLNRVAQQPLQLKLQVFKTENRGWGIRCLNDIPQGGFICIYAGRLLTEQGANEGGKNYGDEYLAELDYIEVVEKLKEGYESDVVEDDSDSPSEEKGSSEARRSKAYIQVDSGSEEEEEEAETSQDARDSDEEFQLSPWEKGKGTSLPEQSSIRTRLRNRNSRHGSDDSQHDPKDKEADSGREKEKEGDRDSDKASIEDRDSRKKSSRSQSSSDHNYSDDEDSEQLRQPSRFAAVSEPKESDKSKRPKNRSVREFFGCDEYCYIMDAKNNGNIGRYLNHSCSPNVFVQNVFVDTHDLRFPWVAFFALTYIHAGTELTWDYNYDVGSVPGKVLHCYCGSNDCRGRLL